MAKSKVYSLEGYLIPILRGEVALPNAEAVDQDVGAAILQYSSMLSGTVLFADGKKQWNARFFLDFGQGGQLYGSGLVAWATWKDGAHRAVAMKFAICRHKKVAAPGANPSRGWSPGHCEKCGLDMTVDSGD